MISEQMITANGVNLWTATQGIGEPMVLCHGGPGGYDYLESVADMVGDICQIIRYDQRGNGRSAANAPYDVSTFVEDMEGLRNHFGFERWIIGGHSWGAGLSLAYAVRYPDHTRAIIHLSGTGIDPRWHDAYRENRLSALSEAERRAFLQLRAERADAEGARLEQIKARLDALSRKADVFHPASIQKLPDFDAYPDMHGVNGAVGTDWDAYLRDPAFHKAVLELPMPVLFIHGEEDPRPSHFAKALCSQMTSGCYRGIEACGHWPWIERPEEMRDILRSFLRNLLL